MSKDALLPLIVIQTVTLKASTLNYSGPFALVIFDVPWFTWGALSVMGYYPRTHPYWSSGEAAISKSVAWIFASTRPGLPTTEYRCERPGQIILEQAMGEGSYATHQLTQAQLVKLHFRSFAHPLQTVYRAGVGDDFPKIVRSYVEQRKVELATLQSRRTLRIEL